MQTAVTTTLVPAARLAARVGLLATIALPAAHGQRAPRPPEPPPPATAPDAPGWPAPARAWAAAPTMGGARLGVTIRDEADTLGIRIEDVERDSPADKARIEAGAYLVSINDVDLRLDPRDMDDTAAQRLPVARLRRELARHAAGDEVTLVVFERGRRDTRRVVLAGAQSARAVFTTTGTGRPMLGVSFAQRGSMRDTAGLLITSITSNGAADKAGLTEGDRIVSIDGTDLRVPAADAGTPEGVQARVSRLRRALDEAREGSSVRLDVLSEGRRRTVQVTPTRSTGFTIDAERMRGMAEELRANLRRNFGDDMRIELRDDAGADMPADARAEIARAGAEARRAAAEARREAAAGQREAARARAEGQREAARAMAEAQRETAREMARTRVRIERDDADADDDDDDGDERGERAPSRGVMRGRTDGSTLTIGGLSLAVVDLDFARQFGRGAEDGALVVRLRRDWEPLKAGDMILSIEGRRVRNGTSLDVTIDRGRDQRFEVLRNGNLIFPVVPAQR